MPRALISVSDKRGLVDFARGLLTLRSEILSPRPTPPPLPRTHSPPRRLVPRGHRADRHRGTLHAALRRQKPCVRGGGGGSRRLRARAGGVAGGRGEIGKT